MLLPDDLVVWNNKIELEDKDTVGLEVASLGEIAHHQVPILHRLVITPHAFALFLKENDLLTQLKHLLGSINHERHDSILQVARYIRQRISHSEVSPHIYKPIFSHMNERDLGKVTLFAHYFRDNKLVGSAKWSDLVGESVLVEHIRHAYAHLFSSEYLSKHTIHHNNHHTFSVCLFVEPQIAFTQTGHISTQGKSKGEFEIEAHNAVRFSYNKHSNKLTHGQVLDSNNKLALKADDLKVMVGYARSCERAFYLPQTMYWGKYQNEFLITKVIPVSEVPVFHDTYHTLVQNITVHPGVTIGRLRIIDEKIQSQLILSDEIVMVKRLDKKILETVKKAKGIIIEADPHPEISHLLRTLGIPSVVKKNNKFLYSTGDVISLNATTGEITRGSMLVS